ncbi:hypothetical protein IEQ34_009796 [Dendrobium chrysotoxum]|uniref:Exonuclease domain-containing protein n=1 Tax=Dendrobium chrysotoxum TaxID=161865 RepID=A0AAV7GZR5_DENCH|nr:hypothetical protein IEQ34_009796 [Dendrobium chrysotoxum]
MFNDDQRITITITQSSIEKPSIWLQRVAFYLRFRLPNPRNAVLLLHSRSCATPTQIAALKSYSCAFCSNSAEENLALLQMIKISVRSSCTLRILKSHAEFFPGKLLEPRICCLRTSATKVERRSQWSHNSDAFDISLRIPGGSAEILKNISKTKSDFHQYKSDQYCSIQKISEDKSYDRPATVLVFDTETTGLSREWGRIIEIAIRDLIGGKNSTFQTLINPGRAVPNTDVHGISSDMVSRPGIPSFEELIPILLQFVSSRQRSSRPVLWIAHNERRFDVPFLIREFKRSKLGSFSLNALREHYRIPLEGPAHRAMQDVNVLAHVVQHITYELRITTLELMQIAFRPSDISKSC